jgi:hypothetical protein
MPEAAAMPDSDRKRQIDDDKSDLVERRRADEDERKFKVAKEIAEQIWREQQLTGSRMTWNLTFQTFLVAAFVVTFGQQNINAHFAALLRIAVCTTGFSVALVTRASVQASQEQRDYLKRLWSKLYSHPDIYGYPRPFAEYQHSEAGRRTPAKILLALLILWIAFALLALAAYADTGWHLQWPFAFSTRHK